MAVAAVVVAATVVVAACAVAGTAVGGPVGTAAGLAIGATVVAGATAIAVDAICEAVPDKETHYARNKNNYVDQQLDGVSGEGYETTEDELIKTITEEGNSWNEMKPENNLYHRNEFEEQGEDAKYNSKYMTEDGKNEVIICKKPGLYEDDHSAYYIVRDPVNMGTYNFGTDPISHFFKDMLPYYFWGNSPEDSGIALVNKNWTLFSKY